MTSSARSVRAFGSVPSAWSASKTCQHISETHEKCVKLLICTILKNDFKKCGNFRRRFFKETAMSLRILVALLQSPARAQASSAAVKATTSAPPGTSARSEKRWPSARSNSKARPHLWHKFEMKPLQRWKRETMNGTFGYTRVVARSSQKDPAKRVHRNTHHFRPCSSKAKEPFATRSNFGSWHFDTSTLYMRWRPTKVRVSFLLLKKKTTKGPLRPRARRSPTCTAA